MPLVEFVTYDYASSWRTVGSKLRNFGSNKLTKVWRRVRGGNEVKGSIYSAVKK